MVYGGGRISLVELKPDLSGIKPGGVNKVLIENVNTIFGADLDVELHVIGDPLRIGVGEVLADVAEAGRAQQRVGARVGDHVRVAVAGKSPLRLEAHAALALFLSITPRIADATFAIRDKLNFPAIPGLKIASRVNETGVLSR